VGNTDLTAECLNDDPLLCRDRASNGPVFSEYIAGSFCLFLTPSSQGGNNYAVPDASLVSANGLDFEAQVTGPGGYLNSSQVARPISPGTLHYVMFGANAVNAAINAYLTGVTQEAKLAAAFAVLTAAVRKFQESIMAMIDEEACSFLIFGAADVGIVPMVKILARENILQQTSNATLVDMAVSGAVDLARFLSGHFNGMLNATLQEITIPAREGCLGFKYVDTIAVMDKALESDTYVARFGAFNKLANVTEHICNSFCACSGDQVLSPEDLDLQCKTSPFFDEIHPSTYFYQLMAEAALTDVDFSTTLMP